MLGRGRADVNYLAHCDASPKLLRSNNARARQVEYVSIERLAVSPRCGVASGGAGNRLSWDDQRRQPQLVVATARTDWG